MVRPISRRVIYRFMCVLVECQRNGKMPVSADSPLLASLCRLSQFDATLGYLECSGLVSLFRSSDQPPVISLTKKGVTYLEDYRERVRERRWSRGLAIAALVISIGSLIASIIALRR